jgi:hypothetical protein
MLLSLLGCTLTAMRIDGYMGSVEFDGRQVTVHKKLRGSTVVLLPHVTGISIENAGIGMRAIRVATAGGSVAGRQVALGSHQQMARDPYALTFRKKHVPEFEAFRDAVYAAMGPA